MKNVAAIFISIIHVCIYGSLTFTLTQPLIIFADTHPIFMSVHMGGLQRL